MAKSPTEIEKEDRQRITRKKTINYFAGAALAYVKANARVDNPVSQAFNLAESMWKESEERYGPEE